jgi:hypothetical protein
MSHIQRIAFVILICGCGPQATLEDVKRGVFGGTANYELLTSAETVKACQLTFEDANQPPAELSEYDEGEFVNLSAAQVNALRAILASPQSYYFGVAKACAPIYGVRIRFESSDDWLDINLCFSCDMLEVTRNGESVGGEDFDPIRPQLVRLCKELFPGDAETQKLKERDD